MTAHRPFRPLPFLGNPHIQTVVANVFSWCKGHPATIVRRFDLPDGDALAAHENSLPTWQSGDPIAVLVHGLGGCHQSGYMRRIANRLVEAGVRVIRLDLRGAGAGLKLARRFYNAACSHDIRAVLAALHAEHPGSPLAVLGFSLGGNIVLKLAGEAGADPAAGLAAVVAVAPPIDLVRCAKLIARQRFYDRFYVNMLIEQVHEHRKHFRDLPALKFPSKTTLRMFDDLYTAPRGGYADAMDYYQRASSLQLIERIQVPCLILTARDDPFIALAPFHEMNAPPAVTLEIADRGGHLGFLGWDGQGGVRWAESRIIGWVLQQLGRCQSSAQPA